MIEKNPSFTGKFLALSLCFFALLRLAGPVSAATGGERQFSELWGENGELWDQGGILRDFTEVGYMRGEMPIPNWPIWKLITDFGAVPNDKKSDLQALKEAIANCPPFHAIGIPDGRFIIDDVLKISANNIVIRGESRDGAILFFPIHMNEITPGYSKNFESFIQFHGGENRGLENLSLILRDEQKATGYVPPPPEVTKQRARHWYYSGENLVSFKDGETNSWMRNVYLKNANNAIRVGGHSTGRITLQNLVLDNFANRTMLEERTDGHMGIQVGSGAERILVHNVWLTGVYNHDITPMGARFSVFSNIRGPNVELDHHAMGNEGNLFTEIDIGYGTRGYGENHNNMDETYWGLKGYKKGRISPPTTRNIFVGLNVDEPNDFREKYWVEPLDPDTLYPQNLYLAQLAFLGKPLPETLELKLPKPPVSAPLRLLPIDDSWVDQRKQSHNMGNDGNMAAKAARSKSIREALLKFDLGDVKADSLAHASLRFYVLRSPGSRGFPLQVEYLEDDSWQEWTVNFENQPEASLKVTDANIKVVGWNEIDLTDFVNQRLALGDEVLSFKLKGGKKSPNLGISSKEGGNEPQLVLHFDESTVPPPEAPKGLMVEPTTQSLKVQWQENIESDLHSYNVYRKTGEGEYKIEAMGLIQPKYEDFVIEPGNTYTYIVRAVDVAGTLSAPSEPVMQPFQ